MPIAERIRKAETSPDRLPAIVRRVLSGEWPETLRGPEIVDVVILIECGMAADVFPMWREDEIENGTWEDLLDERVVARLETIAVDEVIEPEFGCAERAHAAWFATLNTLAPPILVKGRKLFDGNHRLEAARMRGERTIRAYVVQEEEAGAAA